MSIHEIVKSKWTDLDVNNNCEVDAFIIAISQTDEYANDVKNAMDFDFDDLLHGIATDDELTVEDQIGFIREDIRKNAVDLYNNIMEDLAERAKEDEEIKGDYLYELQKQARIDNE